MVARDVGPELAEPFREQCMELVGQALDDLDGYVLHVAIPGIGAFGESAERYINTLLAISKTPNSSHVSFALESLGRIGLGRSDVGDRLTAAITERVPVDPVSQDECPNRFKALWELDLWGAKACPWLPQLRGIRDAWHEQRITAAPRPTEEQDGPAVWARDRAQNEFEMLTLLIEKLESQCDKSDTGPHEVNEEDKH
jgi:hypothetical protein